MATGSARAWRGWVYAAFLAIMLSVAFGYVEFYARHLGPSVTQSKRTTKHVAGSTAEIRNFATEDFPLVFQESLEVDEARIWGRSRDRSLMAAAPTIEPGVILELRAPIADESWHQASLAQVDSDESPTNPSESDPGSQIEASEKVQMVSTKRDVAIKPIYASVPMLDHIDHPDAWPRPTALIQQLEALQSEAESLAAASTAEWCSEAKRLIEQVSELTSLHDEDGLVLFQRIQEHAEQTLRTSMNSYVEPESLIRRRYQVAHAILRRSVIWIHAQRCMMGGEEKLVSIRRPEAIHLPGLAEDLMALKQEIQNTGDVAGWMNYLVFSDLEKLAQSTDAPADHAMEIARKFLSRVAWQRVNEKQYALLSSDPVRHLASKLHPLAYGPVDYQQLLTDLETIESDSIHRRRYSVAQQLLSLRFSSSKSQIELAEAINTFYRNANLRVAVSQEMLQRFLPKSPMVERPVRQKILGADTRGSSQIQTDLAIDLIPDKHAWNIVLNVKGDIQAKTRSSRGPATFFNDSVSFIDTKRSIRVDTQGLKISSHGTSVDSQDSLRGFNTDFDSLPLLGDMLRVVVRQQFDSQRPIATKIMKRAIAEQTDTELDTQLSKQVDVAEQQFQAKLLTPLERMELNPLVVDLETTEQRLIARYRIAGSEQMAAHTPRPLAPSDSHISMQIHESTVNNAIDKIHLSGREWTLQELSHQLADVLQQPHWEIPPEVPRDVSIEFAPMRPLTVEFAEGKMLLTLRVAQLRQPGSIHLENFIIRTQYVPRADGMNALLDREGAISVDGQRLGIRERLQLRTIFARIFAGRPSLPLLGADLVEDERAKGLAVSQLDLRDGWMAIAVSHEGSPHVAVLQSTDAEVR